jgi:hypothetical protein
MKTDVILVEKGKGVEGYLLLQSKGFKTFGSQRLRFDWKTAVITAMVVSLLFIFIL